VEKLICPDYSVAQTKDNPLRSLPYGSPCGVFFTPKYSANPPSHEATEGHGRGGVNS